MTALTPEERLLTEGPLEPGCGHELKLRPVVDAGFDYLCLKCAGTQRLMWTPALVGKGLADVGQFVADIVGGSYVGEFDGSAAVREWARERFPNLTVPS